MNIPETQTRAEISELPRLHDKPALADLGLFAAIFAFMVWGIGSYGLYEPHEGHFAGVGREMLLRGDWVTPHLNGSPYLNKPPLLYWMVAFSYMLFGINEFAARLPLALIGTAGPLIAWFWARQLWGIRAARMATVTLSVSAGWYLFCHQLIIDALLSLILFANAYAMWKATQEPLSRGRWASVYTMTALSMLAKGPIGPVFSLLTFVFFVIIRRRWELLKQCCPAMGLGLVLAVILPWALLLEHQNPGSLYYMLVNENFKRAVDRRWPPDYSVVKVSVPLYILIAGVWASPWSLLLPQVGSFARKKSRNGPLAEGTPATRDAILILSIAAILPVLIFLPMPSRLVYYCLPTVAPFAVLVAGWWSVSHMDCYQKGRRAAAVTFIVLGVLLFIASFFAAEPLKTVALTATSTQMPTYVAQLSLSLGIMLFTGGILLALRRTYASLAAFGVMIGAIGIYNISGFASLDDIWASKKLVGDVSARVDQDVVWISEGSKEIGASAGIAYYLGQTDDNKARTVLVMKSDSRRPPPGFPDPQPQYLMDREQLNTLWSSNTPALFVTDFLRTNWDKDAPQFPDGERQRVATPHGGNRRVYANRAAWQKFSVLREGATGE
jgi:4-amino-4-deoxy-L-arabinose transferase-like glycosyltransferase